MGRCLQCLQIGSGCAETLYSSNRTCLPCRRRKIKCVWPVIASGGPAGMHPANVAPEHDMLSISSGDEDARPRKKAKARVDSGDAQVATPNTRASTFDDRALVHASMREMQEFLCGRKDTERAHGNLMNDLASMREVMQEKRRNVVTSAERDSALQAWFAEKMHRGPAPANPRASGSASGTPQPALPLESASNE